MRFPTYKYETQKNARGFTLVAGCDEVGIGPLAGPVVAATVILDPASIGKQRSKNKWWYRVRDSKTSTEKERAGLVNFVKDHCIDLGVGIISHETIDEINIHQASLLAMRKSVEALKHQPDYLFLDGVRKVKHFDFAQQPVIDGDMKILSISAASIVAKVARDKILAELDELFPVYGFVRHKGYGTSAHCAALKKFGVSPVHRQSFTFVQQVLRQFCSLNYFRKIY